MPAIISAHNVCKTYHTGSQSSQVLNDLSIDIQAGEFTVIMGSSGSGKSSLLYLLSGLDQPTSGSIELEGQHLPELNETQLAKLRRTAVGFVFQDFNLIPNLTILDNVLIAGFLTKKAPKQVRARALELLEMLEIRDLADRLPSQTSGGEQQRCAIARALINEPKVMVADEPTGNLNSATSDTILNVFSTLHQAGQTLVMVTHDLRTACYGERVLFMRDGQFVDQLNLGSVAGKIDQLNNREQILFNWLTEKGW